MAHSRRGGSASKSCVSRRHCKLALYFSVLCITLRCVVERSNQMEGLQPTCITQGALRRLLHTLSHTHNHPLEQ
jgi:hypothetical protein